MDIHGWQSSWWKWILYHYTCTYICMRVEVLSLVFILSLTFSGMVKILSKSMPLYISINNEWGFQRPHNVPYTAYFIFLNFDYPCRCETVSLSGSHCNLMNGYTVTLILLQSTLLAIYLFFKGKVYVLSSFNQVIYIYS